MKVRPSDWISLLVVAAVAGLASVLYPQLPDPVPTRWSLSGDAVGFTAKPWGVIVLAAMPVLPYVLLKVLPAISPAGFRMDAFQRVTEILMATLTVCLGGTAAAALLAASGADVPVPVVVQLLVGGTLIVFGNFLGKVRKNFFIGIRTPWALASDEVWARTHRLAGWLMVVVGVVMVGVALTGTRAPVGLVVGVAVTAAVVPAAYSLILYYRLGGFRRTDEHEHGGS